MKINNSGLITAIQRWFLTRMSRLICGRRLLTIREPDKRMLTPNILGYPWLLVKTKLRFLSLLLKNMAEILGVERQDKMLTGDGKEVLIKAVLQAIPLYNMSCFKLHASLCKRLCGIIAKFWWITSMKKK